MGFHIKVKNPDRYKPLETALKRTGLKVVCMEKHGKKMVITVARYGARQKVF